MVIPLGGGVYVNVIHIGILSGVLPVANRPNAHQLTLVLSCGHKHTAVGTEQEMRALHLAIIEAMERLNS